MIGQMKERVADSQVGGYRFSIIAETRAQSIKRKREKEKQLFADYFEIQSLKCKANNYRKKKCFIGYRKC